ncbi:FmdB family zinc ribbon protein [Nocardioides cynanchi]|uniref:FmdB family zinc ribbon protein n=1 Tax=Nocardioides cynanchi TaxID=2558918 RepID=UPI001246965A|nr:FmdB family zinc ribbon protein [Nocardioides cynanchi]
MPTYQYRCTECDHSFEQFQSFTDDALTVCPACGGRLRKVYNAVGVVFKGSGFYRNDSRDTKTSTDAPAAKSSDSTSTSAAASTSKPDSSSSTSTGSGTTSTPAASGSGSGSAGS